MGASVGRPEVEGSPGKEGRVGGLAAGFGTSTGIATLAVLAVVLSGAVAEAGRYGAAAKGLMAGSGGTAGKGRRGYLGTVRRRVRRKAGRAGRGPSRRVTRSCGEMLAAGRADRTSPMPGSAVVALWRGDRRAAVSLTFDDAMPSQRRHIAPLLARFGFRATFFLPTGELERTRPNRWGQTRSAWRYWRALAAKGHEMGSHSITHPNLARISWPQVVRELKGSRDTIRARIPGQRCATLAYPYAVSNRRVRRLAKGLFVAARGAGFRPESAEPRDLMNIRSVTPYKKTTRRLMGRWMERTEARRGWLVWMLHGTKGQGWEPLPLSTYRYIFGLIKRRRSKLWVAPFGEVATYVRERRAARLSLVDSTSSRLEIELTDNLDDRRYDQPLTLCVVVRSGWSRVGIRQGRQQTRVAQTRRRKGGRVSYVRFDAIPDRGRIVVRRLGGS